MRTLSDTTKAFLVMAAIVAVLGGYAIWARAAPIWPQVGTDINCPTTGAPLVYDTSIPFQVGCGTWPAAVASTFGARVVTDSTGLYVWAFPAGCQHSGNIPYFSAVAEGPTPQGGITVNPQVEGVPTATTVSFRVTKVTAVTVALLGLTILSVPGATATTLDLTCAPQ